MATKFLQRTIINDLQINPYAKSLFMVLFKNFVVEKIFNFSST